MNKIYEAIDQIQENGWTQGILYDVDGSLCALGALQKAHGVRNAWIQGTDGFAKYLIDASKIAVEIKKERPDLEDEDAFATVWKFNDDPKTTREDILLMMKRAANAGD